MTKTDGNTFIKSVPAPVSYQPEIIYGKPEVLVTSSRPTTVLSTDTNLQDGFVPSTKYLDNAVTTSRPLEPIEPATQKSHVSREPVISSTYQQAGLQEDEDSAWEPPTFRTESTYQQTLSHQPRFNTPYRNPFTQQRTHSTFHTSPFSFRTGDTPVSQTPDFNSFFSNQVASFKQEVGFPFTQVHPPSVMSNIAAFSTDSDVRDSVGAISSFSFFRPGNRRY